MDPFKGLCKKWVWETNPQRAKAILERLNNMVLSPEQRQTVVRMFATQEILDENQEDQQRERKEK